MKTAIRNDEKKFSAKKMKKRERKLSFFTSFRRRNRQMAGSRNGGSQARALSGAKGLDFGLRKGSRIRSQGAGKKRRVT